MIKKKKEKRSDTKSSEYDRCRCGGLKLKSSKSCKKCITTKRNRGNPWWRKK